MTGIKANLFCLFIKIPLMAFCISKYEKEAESTKLRLFTRLLTGQATWHVCNLGTKVMPLHSLRTKSGLKAS